MPDELLPDDPVQLWQTQSLEETSMSLEEIREKAVRFERRIRWRNLRETMVALVLIPLFCFFFYWCPAPSQRIGSGLTIAGLVFLIWYMKRNAGAEAVPAGAGFANYVAFHRRELERQRDLLRRVWFWYLGPLLPGILVFNFGVIAPKVRHPADWLRALPFLVILAFWFWATARMNHRAADRLQRDIDELDRFVS